MQTNRSVVLACLFSATGLLPGPAIAAVKLSCLMVSTAPDHSRETWEIQFDKDTQRVTLHNRVVSAHITDTRIDFNVVLPSGTVQSTIDRLSGFWTVIGSSGMTLFEGQCALPVDWQHIVDSEDQHEQYYWDPSSFQVTGKTRVAWFKTTRYGSHDNAREWAAGRTVEYYLDRVSFNCAEKTGRIEQRIYYFSGGATTASSDVPTPWEHAAPETAMAYTMSMMCLRP
jgi:hypothetical protein